MPYEVKPGDTLSEIGRKYGVPWSRIAEANGISDPSQLRVGEMLKIPGQAPAPDTPAPEPQGQEAGIWGMLQRLQRMVGMGEEEKAPTSKASSWVTRPGDPFEYRQAADGMYEARRGGRVVNRFQNAPGWLKKKVEAAGGSSAGPAPRPPAATAPANELWEGDVTDRNVLSYLIGQKLAERVPNANPVSAMRALGGHKTAKTYDDRTPARRAKQDLRNVQFGKQQEGIPTITRRTEDLPEDLQGGRPEYEPADTREGRIVRRALFNPDRVHGKPQEVAGGAGIQFNVSNPSSTGRDYTIGYNRDKDYVYVYEGYDQNTTAGLFSDLASALNIEHRYNIYDRSRDPATRDHFFKLLQEAKSWSKEKDDTWKRNSDGEWVRVERGANDNRVRRPSLGTMVKALMGFETDRRTVGGQ